MMIDDNEWPRLDQDAYHGLAGEVVAKIEPHTESDPVAVLLHYLTYFGNAIGRRPHYRVEGSKHATNLFVAIVGATSKSRKGTAAGRVREIFEIADEKWMRNRLTGGLSTGEGLIWLVRDREEEADKDQPVDKRVLFLEPEFASVFAAMRRSGTLSHVLRDAWDRGDLASLSKNMPARATGALVSIVGHITEEELRRNLSDLAMANGWANRFLFARVRRSKLLPHGGNLTQESLSELGRLTGDKIIRARSVDRVTMTAAARRDWERIYPELSKGHPGLYGGITGRAEAQTIRLALLYALLDGEEAMDVQHLRAASAAWGYCETSARQIFAQKLGDPTADEILRALRDNGDAGMTRTAISGLFKRHRTTDEISTALQLLVDQGEVRCVGRRHTPGRSVEMWVANFAN